MPTLQVTVPSFGAVPQKIFAVVLGPPEELEELLPEELLLLLLLPPEELLLELAEPELPPLLLELAEPELPPLLLLLLLLVSEPDEDDELTEPELVDVPGVDPEELDVDGAVPLLACPLDPLAGSVPSAGPEKSPVSAAPPQAAIARTIEEARRKRFMGRPPP